MYVNESLGFIEEELRIHVSKERLDPIVFVLRENKEFIENNNVISIDDIEYRIC